MGEGGLLTMGRVVIMATVGTIVVCILEASLLAIPPAANASEQSISTHDQFGRNSHNYY